MSNRSCPFIDAELSTIWREMYSLRSWTGDRKDRPSTPAFDEAARLHGFEKYKDETPFRCWLLGYMLDKTNGDIAKLAEDL